MKNIIIIILTLILLFGCSKSTTSSQEKYLSQEEIDAIEEAYNIIKATADSILLSENPYEGYQNIMSDYAQIQEVIDIYLDSTALYIDMEFYISYIWVFNDNSFPDKSEFIMEESDKEEFYYENSRNQDIIGNSDGRIINAIYFDELLENTNNSIIPEMRTTMNSFGLETEIIDSEAGLNFFKTKLNDYGVIIYYGHGIYDENKDLVYIQTADEGNTQFQLSETDRKLTVRGTFPAMISGVLKDVNYLFITEEFIDHYYNSFPNSLIFFQSCQLLDTRSNLSSILLGKGVGNVWGWTRKAYIFTDHLCHNLMRYMLMGPHCSDAYT